MRYVLTIQRIEDNLQYEQELEKWEQENKMRYQPPPYEKPSQEKEVLALKTILTNEQFLVLQKAIIETFK